MSVLLGLLMIVAMPCLAVTLLLKLTERLQDRRDLERDRQVELTEAIHWELGAVAAPVVRRIRRGWRVSMALPLDRSVEVAAIVRLTAKHFGAEKVGERLEIVLSAATWPARAQTAESQTPRPVITDRPLAA